MREVSKRAEKLRNFVSKGHFQDPMYGECSLWEDRSNRSRLVCLEKRFSDQESLLKELEVKKKRIIDSNEFILSLVDYSVEVVSALCATSYILRLFFETEERTLHQDIIERRNSHPSRFYSMGQLTQLMYNQVFANEFLEMKKFCHGDICPQNIAITKKGEFKLAWKSDDRGSERIQMEKALRKSPLFVSPQQYHNMINRPQNRINFDRNKADVFSLGLTILQAGLLKPIDKIYEPTAFNEKTLSIFLKEFQDRYADNPLLCATLEAMLNVPEASRNSFIMIKSAQPDYKEVMDYIDQLERGLINPDYEDLDYQVDLEKLKDIQITNPKPNTFSSQPQSQVSKKMPQDKPLPLNPPQPQQNYSNSQQNFFSNSATNQPLPQNLTRRFTEFENRTPQIRASLSKASTQNIPRLSNSHSMYSVPVQPTQSDLTRGSTPYQNPSNFSQMDKRTSVFAANEFGGNSNSTGISGNFYVVPDPTLPQFFNF